MQRKYNKGGTFLQDLWKMEHLHKSYLARTVVLYFPFWILCYTSSQPAPLSLTPTSQRPKPSQWFTLEPSWPHPHHHAWIIAFTDWSPLLPFISTSKPSDTLIFPEYHCDPVPLLLKFSQKLEYKLYKLYSRVESHSISFSSPGLCQGSITCPTSLTSIPLS